MDEGKRRLGAGRKLLNAVIENAGRQGCRSVILEVRSRNSAAVSLYRKAGFREIARRERYYANPEDDAVIMQLELKTGG